MGPLILGAVLSETVFAFPGSGCFMYRAIFNRDYPVLQGFIIFIESERLMTSAMFPPPPSGGPVYDTAVDDRELMSARVGGGGFWLGMFRHLMHNPRAWVSAVIIYIFLLVGGMILGFLCGMFGGWVDTARSSCRARYRS